MKNIKNHKEKLLEQVLRHVHLVTDKIKQKLDTVRITANQSLKELGKMSPADQAVFMDLRGRAHRRAFELEHLQGSPYFMKCIITDETGTKKDYFFAKHEFSEEAIYSWVAPVSAIRFENPGKASYKLPNGESRSVLINQKETYMIVNGKVLLFALETAEHPRELIYQEHFTKQKSEFVLPEIVAQMEKLQDQVIRAGHKGPLVISGPAGSGKTTLALHRVAYLTQVPDMAELYKPDSILVLVQDEKTKAYFSTLLPSLGINDVHITTFADWACKILGLEGYTYMERYGKNEAEKDEYEYQKLQALREKDASYQNSNLFKKQKKEKKLDRFDLMMMLREKYEKAGALEIRRTYQAVIKGKTVRKTDRTPVSYSLIILDEFQNYLPEQITLLKQCLNEKTESIMYVGDMAQQVKIGTIRDWSEAGEIISPERNIQLHKVYRNTKNILSYIAGLGYALEIPEGLKQGPEVTEKIARDAEEEIEHIKSIISKYKEGSIGILAKDEEYLADFKKEFAGKKNIHVLTMLESQGVEFDLVCLVGVKNESFNIAEKQRIHKDLLYVALTRAISELHILGTEKLKSFS